MIGLFKRRQLALVVLAMMGATLFDRVPAQAAEPMSYDAIVGALVPISGMEDVSEARSVDLTIGFASGSADLIPSGRGQLDALARALRDPRLDGLAFEIVGHTDAVGSAERNQRLSEQRALSVSEYLTGNLGIDPARLLARGEGESRLRNPLEPNSAENRRVEVTARWVAGKTPMAEDREGNRSGAITD